jgi:hypothetical protein
MLVNDNLSTQPRLHGAVHTLPCLPAVPSCNICKRPIMSFAERHFSNNQGKVSPLVIASYDLVDGRVSAFERTAKSHWRLPYDEYASNLFW